MDWTPVVMKADNIHDLPAELLKKIFEFVVGNPRVWYHSDDDSLTMFWTRVPRAGKIYILSNYLRVCRKWNDEITPIFVNSASFGIGHTMSVGMPGTTPEWLGEVLMPEVKKVHYKIGDLNNVLFRRFLKKLLSLQHMELILLEAHTVQLKIDTNATGDIINWGPDDSKDLAATLNQVLDWEATEGATRLMAYKSLYANLKTWKAVRSNVPVVLRVPFNCVSNGDVVSNVSSGTFHRAMLKS